MLPDDIELYKAQPSGLPDLFFFRHLKGNGAAKPGSQFGKDYFYKWWARACRELGIEGVDLYGGTKHTSTTAMSEYFTPDEMKTSGTMHATNAAFERYFQAKAKPSRAIYEKIAQSREAASG
jgi:hypothetical protein